MKLFYLDDDYEYDFDLYGLVSSGKEYTLAWWLNKTFAMRLIKQTDLCYTLPDRQQMLVSNYEFCSEHSTIRLLRNKALGTITARKPYLLPEIKQYDYVLHITGSLPRLYPHNFINTLLRIPLVQYVKQFDPLALNNKENLIF
ncbi:IPExxxVDY family protein [Pontibacter sp. Tf4]|uniref:IPExxxVDY family protein n=1 Tax=Pontibacter sp. Tf4 TaxID=2761620 RepID=UPI001626D0E5|nr:IPExxxVDY family protein [Pontibacter sp. Tf4]MBB6611078.1 IPExxxVDY family protein [Pontibacter sp. Tf4]